MQGAGCRLPRDFLERLAGTDRPEAQGGVSREGQNLASRLIDGVDDWLEAVVQELLESLGASLAESHRGDVGEGGEPRNIDEQHRCAAICAPSRVRHGALSEHGERQRRHKRR